MTKSTGLLEIINGQYIARNEIEVNATPLEMETLFQRIKSQWKILGDHEPFWSVLNEESFKVKNIAENIPSNIKAFYDTGKDDVEKYEIFLSRAKLISPKGICLEFGCGVGRATINLSGIFDKVIGVDISSGNLKIAEKYLRNENIENVNLIRLEEVHDILNLPNFDVLFSFIVLQHNPPPVQKFILEALLQKINHGGICFIQLVADFPDYSFNVGDYLNLPIGIMDVHGFPMPVALDLFQKHGFVIRDVRPDGWLGSYGSFTFLAQRSLGIS